MSPNKAVKKASQLVNPIGFNYSDYTFECREKDGLFHLGEVWLEKINGTFYKEFIGWVSGKTVEECFQNFESCLKEPCDQSLEEPFEPFELPDLAWLYSKGIIPRIYIN